MSVVDNIRQKLDIVSIIGQTVRLKKNGREYIGSCPFHSEKTASFFVNPSKGVFYCFGCQAKGNVFDFYAKVNNVNFGITLQHFANSLGIELQPMSEKQLEQKSYKQQLLLFFELANQYFVNNLKSNKNALDYLTQRGLNEAIIQQFELGYSLDNNNKLWEILYANGAKEEDLIELGLKSFGQTGIIYEPFRDRIMFPIKNINNQTIGFGGRAMHANVQPKYLNSKESVIFHKKENLYGINFAIKNLKHNNLIIVEGYMDVVTLHMQGFVSAVATLGTAINLEHISNINNINPTPIFCLDGDKAGREATFKVAKLYLPLLNPPVNPKFILLDSKDPDDFFKEHSLQDFNQQIEAAKNTSEVIWSFSTNNKDLDSAEEAGFLMDELQQLTNEIKNSNLRQQVLRFFKNKLYQVQTFKGSSNKALGLQKYNTMIEYSRDYVLKGCVLLTCIIKFADILEMVEEDLPAIKFANYSGNNTELNTYLEYLDKLFIFITEHISKFNSDNIVDIIATNDSTFFCYNQIKDLDLYNTTYSTIDSKDKALSVFVSTLESLKSQDTKSLQFINLQLTTLYEKLKSTEAVDGEEYKEIYKKISVLLKELTVLKQGNSLALINNFSSTKY